jgi:LysM repeat protein
VPRAGRRRALTARFAAPLLFLLGVTVAVLLIRSGLGSDATTTTGPVTHASTARVPVSTAAATVKTTGTGTAVAGAVYYTVQTGDTFGSIASKQNTTVDELQVLNPGISSNELQVGQKIRVK